MPDILVVESKGFSKRATQLVKELGDLHLADLDREGLLQHIHCTEILWLRLRHFIDAEIMDAAPNLKLIVTPTTGLNHIDLDEAAKRNISILSLRGESDFLKDIRATAEYTLMLMLGIMRHLHQSTQHVLEGGWNRDLFRGNELFGKTVGLIGYGRLGRIVARYITAFDTRVLVTDPYMDSRSLDPAVELVGLPELLKQADIVSLHVDYRPENHHFFGEQQFSAMKEGSWLINTARGELLDESALLVALDSGRIAGAALDVLSNEAIVDFAHHPLITYAQSHANLIITPHLGGCTVESMERTENFLAEKLSTVWNSIHTLDSV